MKAVDQGVHLTWPVRVRYVCWRFSSKEGGNSAKLSHIFDRKIRNGI